MVEPPGTAGQTAGLSESGAVGQRVPLDIFISYRRSPEGDPGRATQLHRDLAARFGAGHVFLDIDRIRAGDDFADLIDEAVAACDVVIAVIGPQWLSIIDERSRQPLEEWRKDWVRLEIEAALRRWPDVRIVPVLVDGAKALVETELPRTLARLGRFNARELRHASWDRDVLDLIDDLESPRTQSVGEQRSGAVPGTSAGRRFRRESETSYPVDDDHLLEVAANIVDRSVVPILGPGVNAGDRAEPSQRDREYLPDSGELADYLAAEFNYPSGGRTDLAAVSEYARWLVGVPRLYNTLREALRSKPTSSVHRFLAKLPQTLREIGVARPYQMIITTNYDDALERAFDEVNEFYDLALYMASGDYTGSFIHVPYDSRHAVPVADPRDYSDFPMTPDTGELQRTVIVKVHGSVQNWPIAGSPEASPALTEDCVITEDNYIDYLTLTPVNSVVPYAILNKLLMSNVLFLGYNVRDWSLRVLLQRIWRGEHSTSWAIQREQETRLDRKLWEMGFGVELHSAPLAAYVGALHEQVAAVAGARTVT